MIVNAREALALLRREHVLTLTQVPGHGPRSLVHDVVGGPVRGSWWSHPKGGIIFRIGEELESSGEVLVAKLVSGRITYLHRTLWTALYRVVTDPGWREQAAADLSPDAQELLAEVERDGRVEPPASARGAREQLEKKCLVLSTSEHTPRGNHKTVLRSWENWAPIDVRIESTSLSLEDARAALAAAYVVL